MLLNRSYVWEAIRDNELYLRRFNILQIKQHFKTCKRKVETDEEAASRTGNVSPASEGGIQC